MAYLLIREGSGETSKVMPVGRTMTEHLLKVLLDEKPTEVSRPSLLPCYVSLPY